MSEHIQDTPLADDEYEADLITLEDENGEEHTFEVLDVADIGEQRYFAVVPYSDVPAENLAQDAEMLIMRVGEDNGEEYLDIVEDNEELQRVVGVFLQRMDEVYNIDLDDLSLEADE